MLKVGKRLDEIPDFLLGRDIRKIGIKPAHGKLSRIPWFMQNIHGKKTKLRDTAVNSTVREIFFFLEPADKIAQILPGDIFRDFVEDAGKIIKISFDISRIRSYCVVSQATEGDHLPELF